MTILENRLFPISLSIILAAMLPQLGMNIITPALPEMGAFFGVSNSSLPLLITTYLAGYAIAVFGAGVIADRYNIKKIQLYTFCLFIVFSLLCSYARSFELLLVFRFFQALFGCGVTVFARLIVQRVYPAEKHIGIITTLALAVAISPVIAPVLGGILIDSSTWQLLFYVLSLAGLISLVLIGLFIPSLPPKQQTTQNSVLAVLRECRLSVKGTFFYVHLLSISLVSMAQIAFVSSSAVIMQSTMGISAKLYGILLALIAIGFVIGTQITRIVVPKYGLYFIYGVSALIALISSVLMLFFVSLYSSCYLSLVVPMFGLMLTVGLVVPASQAGLLQIKSNHAGYLASVFFFSQIMLSTAYGFISKFIVMSTPYELAIFTVIPSLTFCLYIGYSLKNLRLLSGPNKFWRR